MVKERPPEERFAEEVLRRVLGITVTAVDDNYSDRMVDALFFLPDGSEGALEVTTIGERSAMESEALAAKGAWAVNGAQWAWMVYVEPSVSLRELAEHLSDLVLTCERLGVPSPERVGEDANDRPSFRWLEGADLRLHGFPNSGRPGAIDVLPGGGGGAVFDHLADLPGWLRNRLSENDLKRKIEKLHGTGRNELHLFLRVHETAMPFSLYYPLAWGRTMPDQPLDPPGGLAGVWLAPAWRNPILWWSTASGWSRADCLD